MINKNITDGIDQNNLCHDCAFRLGSEGNLEEDTVATAEACIASNGDMHFLCHHEDPRGGFPVCRGYAQAQKGYTKRRREQLERLWKQ